ncbi:sensor histidine kinase [Paenibacillus sp. UNC451MF]|uniref:sensor histidine kinase n=1 Tax=Paenibacillus sp. UNC451MF TaxID=1449063 RepID=UPI0018CC3677|nr:ATP-binding protein [Paenibacillus sp. UNC451MF]
MRNYIHIQMARQDDRLNVVLEVDDHILHYKTLKLVLQPVLENAIFHGIEPKEGPGCITVTGLLQERDIVFEVRDDGIGILTSIRMSDGGTEFLHDLPAGESACEVTDWVLSRKQGMGLANVHHRIRLHFGDRYGVRVFAPDEGGTRVRLRLPAFMNEEELNRL